MFFEKTRWFYLLFDGSFSGLGVVLPHRWFGTPPAPASVMLLVRSFQGEVEKQTEQSKVILIATITTQHCMGNNDKTKQL